MYYSLIVRLSIILNSRLRGFTRISFCTSCQVHVHHTNVAQCQSTPTHQTPDCQCSLWNILFASHCRMPTLRWVKMWRYVLHCHLFRQQSFRLFLLHGPRQCTPTWICVLLKQCRLIVVRGCRRARCRRAKTQVDILDGQQVRIWKGTTSTKPIQQCDRPGSGQCHAPSQQLLHSPV